MSSTKTSLPIYQLKIKLLDIKPPIWRRLQFPTALRLCCLHDALQVVMGWTDSHLHQFEKDGKTWGVPDYDEFNELDLIDESRTPLAKVLTTKGDSMVYVYDFGDDWRHGVVLEKIIPTNTVLKAPICLGGDRRCPPEDVGGVHGYQEFLEAIFDPSHENYKQFLRWAGGHFDAEEFDLAEVNKKLAGMRWPVRHKQ